MGLISYATAKFLGVSTPSEYLEKELAIFCNINNLQNLKKEHCYELDKSPSHPLYHLQVHFCTATLEGKTVAIVIQYDENINYIFGSIIDLRSSLSHNLLARSYQYGDKDAPSFYIHVLCGVGESEKLKDTSAA